MKLKDIESALPNGFHDAKITAIFRNLSDGLVEIHLQVLVGLPEDDPSGRNEVRHGVLTFKGASILIIEEPGLDSSFAYPGAVNFVLTEDEEKSIDDGLLKMIKCEYHTYTFFVQDWLSNLKLVATDLEFTWR